jgi:3D (Asp-Asp-Asp) domain-containing protein
MIKLRYAILGSVIPMFVVFYYSNNIIDDLYSEINTLKDNGYCEYLELQEFDVTVTTYNPTRSQTDSTPNQTADGTIIKPWLATQYRYVALSRDLLSRWGGPFEYGDYVVIEGTDGWDGVYQVRDTMNPKWTNRVDILTTNSKFKYTNVTLYKYVKSNDGVVDNS